MGGTDHAVWRVPLKSTQTTDMLGWLKLEEKGKGGPHLSMIIMAQGPVGRVGLQLEQVQVVHPFISDSE